MRERYEDEIEEILGQFEASSEGRSYEGRLRSVVARLRVYGIIAYNLINRKIGAFIFISTCLLLSALIVSAFVPGIFGPIMWLVVILLLIFYFSIKSSLGNTPQKRWRGRHIEDNDESQRGSWLEKLAGWFRST